MRSYLGIDPAWAEQFSRVWLWADWPGAAANRQDTGIDLVAQDRERLPALRAAVPASREVPGHLKPRQPRVIPPPRTSPGTVFYLLLPVCRLPALTGAVSARSRAGLLRRPPEYDPLQHRDRGVRLGQLASLPGDQIRSSSFCLASSSIRADCRSMTSSARASRSSADGAPAPSAPARTPTAAVTDHSKHRHHRQITHPARRVATADHAGLRSRRHRTPEYSYETACQPLMGRWGSGGVTCCWRVLRGVFSGCACLASRHLPPGLGGFIPGLAGAGDGEGGVPGRVRGCRHCQAHIRVSGSQVGCAQDGAPHLRRGCASKYSRGSFPAAASSPGTPPVLPLAS